MAKGSGAFGDGIGVSKLNVHVAHIDVEGAIRGIEVHRGDAVGENTSPDKLLDLTFDNRHLEAIVHRDSAWSHDDHVEAAIIDSIVLEGDGEFLAANEVGAIQTAEDVVVVSGEVHDVFAKSFAPGQGRFNRGIFDIFHEDRFALTTEFTGFFLPVEGESAFRGKLVRGRNNIGSFHALLRRDDEVIDGHLAFSGRIRGVFEEEESGIAAFGDDRFGEGNGVMAGLANGLVRHELVVRAIISIPTLPEIDAVEGCAFGEGLIIEAHFVGDGLATEHDVGEEVHKERIEGRARGLVEVNDQGRAFDGFVGRGEIGRVIGVAQALIKLGFHAFFKSVFIGAIGSNHFRIGFAILNFEGIRVSRGDVDNDRLFVKAGIFFPFHLFFHVEGKGVVAGDFGAEGFAIRGDRFGIRVVFHGDFTA